jgi:hypothetical protein
LFASGPGSGRCRRSPLCEFEQVGRPKLVANKSLSHPADISSQTAASSLNPSEPVSEMGAVIPNDWTSNGLATTDFSDGNGDYVIVFQRIGIIFEQKGIEGGCRAGAGRGTHDTSEKLPSLWGWSERYGIAQLPVSHSHDDREAKPLEVLRFPRTPDGSEGGIQAEMIN